MASVSNGNGKWLVWLAGILFTVLLTGFTTLTSHVVANDKDSRSRDEKITDCLTSSILEQKATNQEILIALAEVKSDLKYLRNNTDTR